MEFGESGGSGTRCIRALGNSKLTMKEALTTVLRGCRRSSKSMIIPRMLEPCVNMSIVGGGRLWSVICVGVEMSWSCCFGVLLCVFGGV